MRISPQDRPTVKAQCLRLLVTLKLDPAKMQLISGFVDSYLRLNSNEETLFQSELGTMETREQEQIMQITTSWKEQGIVEGKLEEKLNITLRLLKRKFGTLDNAIAEQIKFLEPSQLDSLTSDSLDYSFILKKVYTKNVYLFNLMMETAKLFQNGQSQAIRLPKKYRFLGDKVIIKRVGKAVVLLPYQDSWETLFDSLEQFSDDFMEGDRQQPESQRPS